MHDLPTYMTNIPTYLLMLSPVYLLFFVAFITPNDNALSRMLFTVVPIVVAIGGMVAVMKGLS